MTDASLARRAVALLDLTNLDDACAPSDIDALCAAAQTPHGPVAAVCVWPRFVEQAKAALEGSGIKVATVVNFPSGAAPAEAVSEETEAALRRGADEIDVVIPFERLIAGESAAVADVLNATVTASRAGVSRPVKAILETAALGEEPLMRLAAQIAVAAGVDFLKTSTGKHPAGGASLDAARALLMEAKAVDHQVGFKASGGVRTLEDAAAYLALADEICGAGWASAERFRFGASGLLTALSAAIEGARPHAAGDGY